MRIDVLVQQLKDSSLLLDGYSTDVFNMHDTVRDAALSIASKEQHIFTMSNCELDEWPEKDAFERYTAISLHNCDIIDGLPEGLKCPELKLFHLESVDLRLPMPDNFFEGMTTLKVLILIGIDLSHLPASIKCLKCLRMLCLEQCVLGDNLSFIGKLQNLRILSLSGSKFKTLPNELGDLHKLQLFDITNCFKIIIQPKVISRLNRLEELYMRNSIIQYEVEGQTTNQLENGFLVDLMNLRKLTTLDISIPNVPSLPNLFFPKLDSYKITVGDFKTLPFTDFKMPGKHETSRALALQLKGGNNIHSLTGIKVLLKNAKILLMGELNGVKNILYELNLHGFQDLKQLFILNNSNVEYIINSMEPSQPQDAFPNLESLNLYKLASIKEVCCSRLTDPSFCKLKTIKIMVCVQLKNLFSFHMVRLLRNLEAIEVSECDSLNEIVRGNNDNDVEFPKLRSLVLRSLATFTGFYTNMEVSEISVDDDHGVTCSLSLFSEEVSEITMDDEHGVTPSFSLFSKEVILPGLESLELSSINIQNIWSIDQPLWSSHFQNLMQLIVNDCNKLEHLLSLSMAARLVNLKGLFVSKCNMMEGIFHPEEISPDQENRMDYTKVCIFPYLKEIKLTNMNKLTEVWHAQVHADCFSSLISVLIQGCKKLDKIFPSHMQGWFRSLESLKVVNCESVEVIFEVKDSPQKDAHEIDTKLQVIILEELPNLKQVWKTDPEGYINFKNLCRIRVYGCNKLSNVLPASVAKDLVKLEDISVTFCNEMKEIVSWEEESETSNEPLVFPEVTHIEFCGLRNIKRFYKGRHTVECPNLKHLAVFNCEKLETFTTETTNADGEAVFSAEKVISNLEYMEIGIEEVKWLQSNTGKYRLQSLKELCLHKLQSIGILYWFLGRIPIPNLEKLKLIRCEIGELVPSRDIVKAQEGLGTVLQLEALTLLYSDIYDLRFERDTVLHRSIERLILNRCGKLVNIAHPSVSFPNLKYLEVASCNGLMHLMASSTANSLVQLTTMKIVNCERIKEIVSDVGNEEERVVNIEFSQLRTLVLVTLESITSFCSCENCEFKFPSLEELIVRNCPKMKTFTQSHIRAPKLQNILANEEEKWIWEGDLNATIQKAFTDKLSFQYTQNLKLSDYPELEGVWNGTDSVQEGSFRNLRSLVISNCEYVVHVIPSHLLACFENLEELEVRECRQVKVIFNIIEGPRMTKAWLRYRLKRFSLDNLPKLEHIWDTDPQGIAGFQALQDMHVDKCESLKCLFPASLAKDLSGLERVFVANCEKLEEIFAMDEAAIEGATKSFVFRCLTSLTLRELPGLKYFYPGLHTLEWPVQELDVYHCNLEIFKFRRSRSSSSKANPFPIRKSHGSKTYLSDEASTDSPDEGTGIF